MSHLDEARKLIRPYLGKTVSAKLDGTLFDHEPDTFCFAFRDPAELRDDLAADYTDELTECLPCLDEEAEWSNEDLVPVATVSVDDYEFAWLFFDWRDKAKPSVLVTTTDDWGEDRGVASLEALNLQVS